MESTIAVDLCTEPCSLEAGGSCTKKAQESMIAGLALVMFAAVFQGVFLLPASRMRNWAWEHWWLGFSLFGMLLGNWALGAWLLPHPLAIYAAVSQRDFLIMAGSGL